MKNKAQKKPIKTTEMQGDILMSGDWHFAEGSTHNSSRREKATRTIYIALGVIFLGYIYSDSLVAQQASKQRVSIIKAVDFPSDI